MVFLKSSELANKLKFKYKVKKIFIFSHLRMAFFVGQIHKGIFQMQFLKFNIEDITLMSMTDDVYDTSA